MAGGKMAPNVDTCKFFVQKRKAQCTKHLHQTARSADIQAIIPQHKASVLLCT